MDLPPNNVILMETVPARRAIPKPNVIDVLQHSLDFQLALVRFRSDSLFRIKHNIIFLECGCNEKGSTSLQCGFDGDCICKTEYAGIKCDRCASGSYNATKDGHDGCLGKTLQKFPIWI